MDWELMTANAAMEEATGAFALTPLRKRLAERGVYLTEKDLARIGDARADVLARFERIELGEPPVLTLADELASSSYFDEDNASDLLICLQERFYELRDEAPEGLSDAALVEGLAAAFDRLGGDVLLVCSLDLAALMGEELTAATYCVSDGAGKVYAASDDDGAFAPLDPGDFADGWDGEKWGDDLD